MLISWMVTLSSCLSWQKISFTLPPNEYGCIYAWTTLRCDWLTEDADFGKKSPLFRWSSFWSWRIKKSKFILFFFLRHWCLLSLLRMSRYLTCECCFLFFFNKKYFNYQEMRILIVRYVIIISLIQNIVIGLWFS